MIKKLKILWRVYSIIYIICRSHYTYFTMYILILSIFIAVIFFHSIYRIRSISIISADIKGFLNDSKNKTYELFKLNYSDEEIYCMNNFNIITPSNFEYFGNVKLKNLRTFLNTIGANSSKDVTILHNVIQNMVYNVAKGYGKKAVWVSIRVSLPNNGFDIPRWHNDGKFFDVIKIGCNEKQSKFITTLKGPGTLLCNPCAKIRDELLDNAKKHKYLAQG